MTSVVRKGVSPDTPTVITVNKKDSLKREAKPKPKPKRPSVIPAVKIHREVLEAFVLSRGQQNALVTRFEDELLDEGRWRRVLQVWKMRGYNPKNLEGQLDWYDQGGPPGRKDNRNGNHQKSGNPVRKVVDIYKGVSGDFNEATGEWISEPVH